MVGRAHPTVGGCLHKLSQAAEYAEEEGGELFR